MSLIPASTPSKHSLAHKVYKRDTKFTRKMSHINYVVNGDSTLQKDHIFSSDSPVFLHSCQSLGILCLLLDFQPRGRGG